MRSVGRQFCNGLESLGGACLLLCLAMIGSPDIAHADMSVPSKALEIPGIKGDDNRVRVRISDYPWRMIGRLNRNGSHCTGILVGPSYVLTAAHCFWDSRRNNWSVPSAFHFVLGYEKGVVKAHSKIERFELANGHPPSENTKKSSVENDWAIAYLEKPLGEEFGFAAMPTFNLRDLRDFLSSGSIVVQAGYSRDIAHILTADEDCEISGIRKSKSGPLLLHQCDATRGDSGSPLFLYDGKTYSLIGIHVATISNSKGKSEGVAVSMDMFRERISRLPK